MLKDNLYTIGSVSDDNGQYETKISIDKSNDIFNGHFPGQSVLPGVCLLEMLKDILKEVHGQKYKLVNGASIKYMKMVDPNHSPTLLFKLSEKGDDDQLQVSATSFLEDGEPNFKFKGQFTKA
ncbi:hypothetical protein [Fulvivirga ligni]|uniref:hypothetical protein n=1 Tax=Fulvivirga ligni TaxID=2904246 RepID=UPI001F2FE4AC|nr:hypothetical protein [Fulvivirga ligni]UII22960.1 hypothetical protein LVD16_06955 [Fulvivirga ligni]